MRGRRINHHAMMRAPVPAALDDAVQLQEQLAAMRPLLLRFASKRLRSRSAAEDAVQDALIAVLEHPERYAGRSSLRTYVIGILKFKIIDNLRRSYRECDACPSTPQDEQQVFAPDGLWEPLRLLQEAEFIEVLNQGLEKLSSNARHAFVLREYEGMDIADLCEELAVTASNAWVLLHRARSRLRDHLTVHWLDAHSGDRWIRPIDSA
jgi:RNA polymerase sigma-70 factor (ECF subfamily)